ncbi:MAG: hypothetical protein WAK33_10045 [Silvibacterium sp.]
MGKPKKGGYPAPQPITHYIQIIDGKINPAAVTIAWGDWVAWTNKDAVSYTLVLFKNGEQTKWATLDPNSTSARMVFNWPSDKPKDPVVYDYGMLPPGTAKATITAQISRF